MFFAQNKYEVIYLTNGSFIREKIIEQSDSLKVQIVSLEGNTFTVSKTEIDSVRRNQKYKALPAIQSSRESDISIPENLKDIQQLSKSWIIEVGVGYAPDILHKKGEYTLYKSGGWVSKPEKNQGNMSAGFIYSARATRVYRNKLGMSFCFNYLQRKIKALHEEISTSTHNGTYSWTNDVYVNNRAVKFSHSFKLHHAVRNNFIIFCNLGYSISLNEIYWIGDDNIDNTEPWKVNAGFFYSIGTYIKLDKMILLSLQFSDSEIITKQNQEYTDLTLSTRSFDLGLCFMISDKIK